MFKKILVANRGQLAIRVMHTCQELGVRTVGIYSQEDKKSPHVFLADEAYMLGEGDDSYSDVGAILRIANKSNADAIHPGDGLLSEDPSFADACQEQKIPLIGPSRDIIRKALHRRRIREAAANLGIPTVPEGRINEDTNFPEVKKYAEKLGYPVVFKPASGSGRGMRVVESERDLEVTFLNEKRETFSHFGNYDILLEKYLPHVRYLEVPVALDHKGQSVVFPERDGSLQRRHRPLIEETPAYGLSERVRDELRQCSLALAKEVGYVGITTFQYLFDTQQNQVYFLELSTELGAGHPATELVTGVDLLEWQLKLAAGEELSFKHSYIRPRGVAIACRIAAEDPIRDFTATTGVVQKLVEARGPGVRVDSGLYEQQPIPLMRDPMIAQLSVQGFDRARALARLKRALEMTVILGVDTNIPFLAEVAGHPDFVARPVTTRWLAETFSSWEPPYPPQEALLGIAVADALAEEKEGVYAYRVGRVRQEVKITRKGPKQFNVEIEGRSMFVQADPFTPGSVRVSSPLRPGQDIWADYARAEGARYVSVGGRSYVLLRDS